MSHARWTLFAIIFIVSAACYGQQRPSIPPELDVPIPPAHPDSAGPVRNPHSNAADLTVPLCPAKPSHSLSTDRIAGNFPAGGTKAPQVKRAVDASFSDDARQQKILESDVVIGLIVDARGKPQDVCLFQSAGYGLDAEAAKAVQQFRFAPATKDGKPVPVLVHIQVHFKL